MQVRKIPIADADLGLAARFQASLLARECPQCSETACVTALYQPVFGAAGDFYDIIPAGDEHRWFLVGDVCGRGTRSALLMSMVLGYLWGAARTPAEPADIARSLNEFLLIHAARNPDAEIVTTLFLGLLDLSTLNMRYINAGHPSAMVQKHKARRTAVFGDSGVMLGVEPRADWVQQEIAFTPGDRLVLYTDGLLAARTITGEVLGPEGLLQVLDSAISEDDQVVLSRLSARLAKPGESGHADDDRTLMLTSFLDTHGA